VRIVARSTLKNFCKRHRDAEQPLKAWIAEAKKAKWQNPNQIKEQYRSASILKEKRVVFNIAGNKYRLIIGINYDFGVVYIKFVGTHSEYDAIDMENI